MRKIIDVTLINTELHLLDLRINILQDVVDEFYVVQATKTFSGLPKKTFSHNDYSHPKLHYVTIEFPEGLGTWDRDHYQRNYKVLDITGYKRDPEMSLKLSDDDIVLISDLDEVPNPEKLLELKKTFNPDLTYSFTQIMHQYYLNNQNISEPWAGSKACSVERYTSDNLIPQQLRDSSGHQLIENGGWHWSFLGDEEFLKNKIESYAHQEHNNRFTKDSIIYRKDDNKDIFDRGFTLQTVKLDSTYPTYILENQDKLKQYIKEVE